MPKVVGEVVKSASSWNEEVATLFANQTRQIAENFVKLRQLKSEHAAALVEEAQATNALPKLKNELKKAQDHRAHVVATMQPKMQLWLCAVLILVLVGIYLIMEHFKQKKALDEAIADADSKISAAKSALSKGEKRKKDADDNIVRLNNAIEETTPTKKSFTIGRVLYPVKVTDLAGYKVALDYIGSQDKTKFQIPDLAADEELLEDISDNLEDIAQPPVLCRPSKDDEEGMEALVGEEKVLKTTLDSFQDMVKGINVLQCDLPLSEKDSSLNAIINTAPVKEDNDGGIVMTSEHKDAYLQNMNELTNMVARQREVGGNVSEQLMGSYTGIKDSVELYSGLRKNAHIYQNNGFLDILSRSDWLSHNFYCPECNRIPDYLYDVIGIHPEKVRETPYAECLSALMRRADEKDDTVMQERIESEMENFKRLYRYTNRYHADWTSLDENNPELYQEIKVRKSEFTKYDKLLQQKFMFMITGDNVSITELNPSTKLKYDPNLDMWHCKTCDMRWDQSDEASTHQYGKLKKIKEQILLPLWNNLWNEKADLVATETKRSSEELRMRSTQESDRLQGIADKYSDDMRPVRLKMGELTAGMGSKKEQLKETLGTLKSLGLMGDDMANVMLSQANNMVNADELVELASENELLLEQEKQLVTFRRPQIIDIKDQLKSPTWLFKAGDPIAEMDLGEHESLATPMLESHAAMEDLTTPETTQEPESAPVIAESSEGVTNA